MARLNAAKAYAHTGYFMEKVIRSECVNNFKDFQAEAEA